MKWLRASLVACLAACQSAGEPGGIADLPPLDCAVLVTGGAFLQPGGRGATFTSGHDVSGEGRAVGEAELAEDPSAAAEAIPIERFVDELRRHRVFHRVALDGDAGHRRRVRAHLQGGAAEDSVQQFLQRAREEGFDLLLVIEELQDGPIDEQGTNGRWPITFATWILLGFGALIPDRTFESRATLRVTLRELQSGRVLHDPLLAAGPVELALFERSDLLGLLLSIVVPPFWVADDQEMVAAAVRATTQQRLLLSLARDLKSESVRQRLRERGAARIVLVEDGAAPIVRADSAESLSLVRLRGRRDLPPEAAAAFERELLASRRWDGERFHYEAVLPEAARTGRIQVLLGTIRGSVASATFAPGAER